MKNVAILAMVGAIGALGCSSATTTSGREPQLGWSGVPWHGPAAMRVGEAHVLDTLVNPLAPVVLAPAGDSIAVSYARGARARTVARVDAVSLAPLSTRSQPGRDASDGGGSADGAARVVLKGNRFLMVWKRGSSEWGEQAMAQVFGVDGTPRGAPVVVSPRDVDVMATPQAVTTDGQHVVVTFAGASADSIRLLAVTIDPEPSEPRRVLLADR